MKTPMCRFRRRYARSSPFLVALVVLCFGLSGLELYAQTPDQPAGGIKLDPSPPSTAPELPTTPGDLGSSPGAALERPKATKHEISVSADFLYGQGDVTLPFFFSLSKNPDYLGSGAFPPSVVVPPRESDYFGVTLSYSPGQAWYFDFSYAHGTSSGNVDVPLPGLGSSETNSTFNINDDLYQAYIRYAFPGLRGSKFSAYLRAGVSYVDAELEDRAPFPEPFGTYHQRDETQDILGNLGFGLGYSIYSKRRVRVGLQLEGEGFYGHRSQESQETLPNKSISGPRVSIDNNLYGGIGRLTGRFQYAFGKAGLFKAFADFGIETKYTLIEYKGFGTPDELLWGPYIKVGVRYSF
jgi:hypothetical protein